MINLEIVGAGWLTVGNAGCLGKGDSFSMPVGALVDINRNLYSDNTDKRWGRLDNYSKAGIIAAALALQDTGRKQGDLPINMDMVISSVTGTLDTDRKYFESVIPQDGMFASPNLFAYTLPSCVLGEISIRFSLIGFELVLSQSGPDMLEGIKAGANCLMLGMSEQMLAGYCNVDDGLTRSGEQCKAGSVFLVMKKTANRDGISYNGSNLVYNGEIVNDLISLMNILTYVQDRRKK